MEIRESKYEYWSIVSIHGSVDALNTKLIIEPILALVDADNKYIALDLEETSFLSLPAIKFLGNTARLLAAKGGEFLVLSPNERTKRHIEVFTGFKFISCLEKLDFYKETTHNHRVNEL